MLPLGTCRCDEAVVVANGRVVDEGVGDHLGLPLGSCPVPGVKMSGAGCER